MTLSDEQLLEAVRGSVTDRPVPPGPGLDDVLARGRRRTSLRRGVAVGAIGLLAVGAAVAVQLTGLPFVNSSPPAAPSVTLAPVRGTNLDDAAEMRPALEQALGGLGLVVVPENFAVSYSRAGEYPVAVGAGVAASAATSEPFVFVRTAHVEAGVVVASVGCDEAVVVRPDAVGCTSETQADGSLLLDLEYESARELVLLHPTGWVFAEGEVAQLDRLRALVLDPTLRW
jgi:hypothetical protein